MNISGRVSPKEFWSFYFGSESEECQNPNLLVASVESFMNSYKNSLKNASDAEEKLKIEGNSKAELRLDETYIKAIVLHILHGWGLCIHCL